MVPPAALCHPLGPFRAPKVEAPLSVGMPSAELASPTAPTTLSFRVGAGASCGIHLPVAGGGDPRMAALMRMPLSAAAAIACQFSEQAAADVLLSGGVRVAPDTSGPRANGDGPRFTALVQLDPLKDAEVKAKTTFSHQLQCVRVHATHLTNSGDSAPKEVDVFTGEGPLLARLAVVAPELLPSGQLSPDGHYRGYTVRLLHSQTDFRPICSALPGLLVIDRKAHWLSRLEPLLHLPGVVLGGGKAALLPPATDSASLRLSHRLDCLADGYILLDPGVPPIERATFGPEGGVTWTSVGGAAGSFPPVCRVVVAMHESVQATDGPLRGRHLVAWSATPIAMTRVGGIMGANGKPLTVLSSEMTPNVRGPPPSVDVSSSPPFAPPRASLPPPSQEGSGFCLTSAPATCRATSGGGWPRTTTPPPRQPRAAPASRTSSPSPGGRSPTPSPRWGAARAAPACWWPPTFGARTACRWVRTWSRLSKAPSSPGPPKPSTSTTSPCASSGRPGAGWRCPGRRMARLVLPRASAPLTSRAPSPGC